MALIVVAMVSVSQNKTGTVVNGSTTLKYPLNFTNADTIDASETYWVLIDSRQDYAQIPSVAVTLATVSGSPSVAISLEGKASTLDNYTEIVSAVTWTSSGNNPVSLVASSSVKYRYFKVKFVASGATQKTKVTGLTFTTTYQNLTDINATTAAFSGRITGTGGATITGAATNINASSNFATNIGTGTTNAAVTIGGGSNTVAINSSDWDITTTGVMTGIGAITADGLITGTAGATLSGAAINLNASSNFAVNVGTGSTNAAISIGGGSNTVAVNSSSWDVTTAGVASGLTKITVTNDGDNVILDPTTDLHAIDVQINSASKFNVDTTGIVSLANAETISNTTDGIVEISGVTKAGLKIPAPILNTDGSETLDATMSGKMCVSSKSDGATTWTIPDPSAATVGVIYYIMQTADQDLILTATTADSNSIVCDGVATSDSVTISTVSHKIGSGMIVIGISATQWYVGGLNPESVLTPEAAD